MFQNVNPIQSDRKFNSETDKIYVKMLWGKCIPLVYLKENFMKLSQWQIIFQKANSIIKVFVEQGKTNIEFLPQYLVNNVNFFLQLYTQKYTQAALEYIISLFLIIAIKSGMLQNIRKKIMLKQQKS